MLRAPAAAEGEQDPQVAPQLESLSALLQRRVELPRDRGAARDDVAGRPQPFDREARQKRLTNSSSSRLATPRSASASSASPGTPLAAATATTGPLAEPPPPTATFGRDP